MAQTLPRLPNLPPRCHRTLRKPSHLTQTTIDRHQTAVKPSYRFNFLDWSSKYSEARQDSARMVAVGFLSGFVVKDAPSVTNKFFTSCAWQNALRAEVLGSEPIRTVPTSCATPPAWRCPQRLAGEPVLLTGVPPAASMIARKLSFISAAILTSFSLQAK